MKYELYYVFDSDWFTFAFVQTCVLRCRWVFGYGINDCFDTHHNMVCVVAFLVVVVDSSCYNYLCETDSLRIGFICIKEGGLIAPFFCLSYFIHS